MSENGGAAGEGESVLHGDKVTVDPGTPPSLSLKRKLNTKDYALTEFGLSLKEKISMAPIGYRLWRYLREEKTRDSEVFLDPFTKRPTSSCHGVPLGDKFLKYYETSESTSDRAPWDGVKVYARRARKKGAEVQEAEAEVQEGGRGARGRGRGDGSNAEAIDMTRPK